MLKVSIITISYNQEKYIKQALDSFVMQKCNFNYEVIVADDCSSDRTQDFIKEYAKKYPNIIKPILRKNNIGAWNNFLDALNTTKGKYIALCEGDDYWTDENKLQKQVDFLEKHPDYSVCFHPVRVFFENKEKEDYIFPRDKIDGFTFESLLEANFIQTNSVMYKRQNYKGIATDVIPGDWYLHLYHAKFGKIGFINKVMSDYRRHSGGIWWGTVGNQTEFWKKNGIIHLNLYKRLLELFGDKEEYKKIIMKNAGMNTSSIIIADDSSNEGLIHKIVNDFPGYVRQAMMDRSAEIGDLKNLIRVKEKELNNLRRENDIIRDKLDILIDDRVKIYDSWNYRVGKFILFVPKLLQSVTLKMFNNNSKVIKVAVVAKNITTHPTSSAFIRLITPLTSRYFRNKIDVRYYLNDEVVDKIDKDVDICIVQRTAFASMELAERFISLVRSKGMKLIVDTDDAFSRLEKGHQQYAAQRDLSEVLQYLLQNADRVWVSTRNLAKEVGEKAIVLRNVLDSDTWGEINKFYSNLQEEIIKAVYMGTGTHDSDFNMILPALDKINKKYGNKLKLYVIGVMINLPKRPWIIRLDIPNDSSLYPRFVKWFMQQGPFDVGLAPLENSDFNKAKSDIKVLDYLYQGTLPVVSDIEPYKSHELDKFIIRVGYGENDWYNFLEDLLLHKEKYVKFRKDNFIKAERYLKNKRSTKVVVKLMHKELRKLL